MEENVDVLRFGAWVHHVENGGLAAEEERGWQVRQSCHDDWILSLRMFRVRERSRFEVGLMLAEDHEKFVRGASIQGAMVFILSDAYAATGRMAVDFVGPPEGYEPTIPSNVLEVARELGCSLGLAEGSSRISDSEGRALYAAITGFSSEARRALEHSDLDLVRACFVVHRGIWSTEEVEYLVRNCTDPRGVFDGSIVEAPRVLFKAAQHALRTAVMADRTRAALNLLLAETGREVVTAWLDEVSQRFTTPEPMKVSVLGGNVLSLKAGESFTVFYAPRSAAGYRQSGAGDLLRAVEEPVRGFLVVTKDVEWIKEADRTEMFANSHGERVGVLPLVDTLFELDLEALHRVERAASSERPPAERPE